LAVNLADEALYTKDATGAIIKLNAPSIDDKNTGATKHVTIDASGNVLIGSETNSFGGDFLLRRVANTANLDVFAAGDATENNIAKVRLYTNASNGAIGLAGNALAFYAGTVNNERMRIHSDGNVSLINGLLIGGLGNPGSAIAIAGSVISSGAGTHFLKWNSTSGVVTFDTSSRLVKENIVDSPYGLNEVVALKPRKYFRTDDQREEIGFVADEVVGVMPEFTPMMPKSMLTKNEEDVELVPGGVNYDKLTAVLVKAIQELNAKVDAQAAEIELLKG